MSSVKDTTQSVSTKELEAQELYVACRDELQHLQVELQEHDAEQEQLIQRQSACEYDVRAAQKAIDDAKAELSAAEEKLQLASEACAGIQATVELHESRRTKLLALIDDKADELDSYKYHVETTKQKNAPQPPEIFKECDEVTEVTLRSWTVGRIWCPKFQSWVPGYQHSGNRDRVQRFIMHLDSGNSAVTVMSKVAFDFLGLSSTAEFKGMTKLHGVTGSATCPTYEIKMYLDVVNSLKPGTIFQRTMIAAVQPQQLQPGQVGYYDLLLSASDSQKLVNVTGPGRKLRFEMLTSAPQVLYDGQPIDVRGRWISPVLYWDPLKGQQPSQPSQQTPGGDSNPFADFDPDRFVNDFIANELRGMGGRGRARGGRGRARGGAQYGPGVWPGFDRDPRAGSRGASMACASVAAAV